MKKQNSHPLIKFLLICSIIAAAAAAISVIYNKMKLRLEDSLESDEDCDCCDGTCNTCEFDDCEYEDEQVNDMEGVTNEASEDDLLEDDTTKEN